MLYETHLSVFCIKKNAFRTKNTKNYTIKYKITLKLIKLTEVIKIIDNICKFLTDKIRKEDSTIDDERAEIINYGLQLVIGEIPKIFFMIAIAFLLGIGKLTLITFAIMLPYKAYSGGFHLKTHIGCALGTPLVYCGIAFLSKSILIQPGFLKYIITLLVWFFGMLMVKLYAPADTENIPILSKKERKQKKIMSYITLTLTLIIGLVINNNIIFNIVILGMFIQSLFITRLAYKLTNNKYGYEVYNT